MKITPEDQKLIEEIADKYSPLKDYDNILKYQRAEGSEDVWKLLSIIAKQQKCIDLLLYYVNGDATWESLTFQCEKIMEGKENG